MLRSRVVLAALVFAALSSLSAAAATPTIVTPDNAQWQPVPNFTGWQMAIVVGNPAKAGEYYAYLLKAPAGGKAPPHFHKMTENVTVISGDFMVGLGDTINPSAMKTLPPGTVASIPAGVHHYAIAKSETILVVSGIGPDDTTLL